MGRNLTQLILRKHLVSGKLETGTETAIRVDQTLLQDATGTMACLEFEAIGVTRVKTKLSCVYIDHNTLQTGFENSDDHKYLLSMAQKYGMFYSMPGNGICHQVHLERFAVPGQTLLGADSHTPTCGSMGMIAIGAGGLDVAVAMAGQPFYFQMPEVVLVELTGHLKPWVSPKDVVLHLLGRIGVKGGAGKIFEYGGNGLQAIDLPGRATIANMGTETGCTTSIFPCDRHTRAFLLQYGRQKHFRPLKAEKGAKYDGRMEINLSKLSPLVACPHSPAKVVPVGEVAGRKLDQIVIGSCTNSSCSDLTLAAHILKGKRIARGLNVSLSPGSRHVLRSLIRNGALDMLLGAGVRILEPACGPCIGMGQAPPTGGVSLRTCNRNFPGRSGTPDSEVYLSSVEVAAASALTGKIADPRNLPRKPVFPPPKRSAPDDSMIVAPPRDASRKMEVFRGPNIKPLPLSSTLADALEGVILLKLGDNISTDEIMPAGADILRFRSNLPEISEYAFRRTDPGFVARAKQHNGGFIIAGENYGQGSSREHAALAPMHLGVRAVIAKSFARIHYANLVNCGILPLHFEHPNDYTRIDSGDKIAVEKLHSALKNKTALSIWTFTRGISIQLRCDLTERQCAVILAGGLLNHTRARRGKKH